MKKLFLIISILPLCLCLYYLVTVVFPAVSLGFQTDGVSNLGTPVDNDYNNRLFDADFIRVEDSLYYFYYADNFGTGLYKISNQKTERIFNPMDQKGGAYPIRTYNGKPVLFYQNAAVYMYDTDEKKMVDLSKEPMLSKINQSFLNTEFGIIYEKKNFVSSCYALSLQTSDREKTLVELDADNASIEGYYVRDGLLYYNVMYSNKNPSLRVNHLREYNLSNGTDRFLYDFGSAPCYSFLIESNCLVYLCNSQNSLYLIDLDQDNLKSIKIYSSSDLFDFNAYNGKMYIPTKEGLISYDLQTKVISTLNQKSAISCYIVDDYWVYFVSEKNSLWRVPQAGGEVEKVFG